MYGYEKNAGLEGGGKMLHGMKAKKWEERQREKLEKIYSLYKNKMFGRAMQILNQREDAEDAVQNCIIAISRHTECIDLYDEARTLSFVYTVISHCAIDIYRKNKKSRQSNLNIDDVAEQAGNIDIENEVLVSMELKRVVVTGLGAITPVGNSVPEFWENLVNGVSGAGPITHFDASLFKTQFACEVKDFDATKYIDRKEARKMDLYTQYAIAVAKEAVSDSGLDVEKEDLNKIGVIFGAGIGGIHTFEEEVGNYYTRQEMGPKFNPFFIPKMISDIAAGQISIMYGFHGPNYATCSACATSTNAIADAFNLIRLGKANVIVSGGSEAAIFPAGVGGFNAMHALSTRNDEASKASRPFSASRDGFVMGEGGGCLILA